jgi:hypothetical protein
MLSKEYLETTRTLVRLARNMSDQTIADRLKALAEDYERRAESASRSESAKSSAPVRTRRAPEANTIE